MSFKCGLFYQLVLKMHNVLNSYLCDLIDRKIIRKKKIVSIKTLFNNDKGSKKLHAEFKAFLIIKSRS